MRPLALAAVLAFVAAACGGAGEDPGSSAATSPDGTAEATTPSATGTGGTAGAASDGPLAIGYLLPETGPLVSLGPGVIAATRLAVEDVNAAGGVLGAEVSLTGADSAGDTAVAAEGVNRLLSDGVDAIVGAVSSAISLSVLEQVTSADVAMCSGSNTSKTFTTVEDDGLYVRTVPSNVMQAPVLANEIIADGAQHVALLVRADDYGASIGGAVESDLTASGARVTRVDYDPNAPNFTADVDQALAGSPDAVVVVAFDEGAQILRELIERGAGPRDVNVYGTDGMGYGTLAEQVAPGEPELLEGMKGTQTSSAYSPEFDQRLREADPSLEITNFAAYFYDCVVTLSLAAEAAGTTDAGAFKDELVAVTRDGQACGSFEECAALLSDGEDIDYQGVSGPLDFVEVGEPDVGIFDVIRFDDQGSPEIVDTVEMQGSS